MELDSFDLKILSELDINSRQSYQAIGKKINRSKQFVSYRIGILKEKKVILSDALSINLRELEYNLFNMLFQFKNVDEKKDKLIMSYLKKSENVGYCLRTLGNWDLFISVKAKNINEFYMFLGEFHKLFQKCIKKEIINIELSGIETNLKFLNNTKEKHIFVSYPKLANQKNKLNENEQRVIKILRSDPLIEYLYLSEKADISYTTLIKIIKRLKNFGIIKRTHSIIDNKKLGFNRYLFLINLNYLDNSKTKELLNYLGNQDKINYVIQSVGYWNLICNVYSKDVYELTSIINHIKNKFKEEIESIEFLQVINNEKDNFSI